MTTPLETARGYLGTKEVTGPADNPKIMEMYKTIGQDWVEHDEMAWCAAFVGHCLETSGVSSTRKLNARSYLAWGEKVPSIEQAKEGDATKVHACLADFVAPETTPLQDHVGAFAVSCTGSDALVRELEAKLDDYAAIIVKALADRLAEAAAEMLHEKVRRAWYAPTEDLANDDLVSERYRGIRPAFGYPACPDHTLKGPLFELLGCREVGITLTESFAMWPASSVSGLYLAHPEARYFNVGKIGRDQVEDYARRMGETVAEVERYMICQASELGAPSAEVLWYQTTSPVVPAGNGDGGV